MRVVSVILLVLCAGCLGSAGYQQPAVPSDFDVDRTAAGETVHAAENEFESADSAPGAAEDLDQSETADAPPSLHRESKYTVGIDPRSAGGRPCDGPALNNCDRPTFRIDETYDVHATLAWTLGSDLDLYLYQGDQQLSADGVNPTLDLQNTTQELYFEDLPAGDYSMWVTVRYGFVGNYTLDVEFITPP